MIEGARILIWQTQVMAGKVETLLESRLLVKGVRTWRGRLALMIFSGRFRRWLVAGAILFPGLFHLPQLGNFNVWRLLQYPIVVRYLKRFILTPELEQKSILDLGSGDTPLSSYLAQRFGVSVTPLDRDAAGLIWQSQTYSAWSLAGKVVLADIEHLPFRNESFPAISCVSVLEHVKKDDKAIEGIERLLRENGWLILSVPFSYSDGREVQRADGSLFFRYYSLHELARKFSKLVLVERCFAGKQLTETVFHPDRPIKWGRAILLDYVLGNILSGLEQLIWSEKETAGIGDNACRIEGIFLFRKL